VKSGSKLERVLASGQFAVTAEAGPPRGSQAEVMLKKGGLLKDSCDAVNVTDNQIAMVRMSRPATGWIANFTSTPAAWSSFTNS